MIMFDILINRCLILSYWLLILSITLRVLMKRRTIYFDVAWLLIIYIFPMLGIMSYFLFGEFNLGKQRTKRRKAMWPSTIQWIDQLKCYTPIFTTKNSDVAHSLFQLCRHRQGMDGLKANNMQLFSNTDNAITALIQDIDLAKHHIEMVFYIWQSGGIVDKVSEALMVAAKRGVYCRIMLDSVGSVEFFRSSHPAMFRAAGIHVVEALHVSIFRVFLHRMDLRQHRKMVLIDNRISYTGSMNMVDPHYFKKYSGVGEWIDLMTRIEGPVTIAMGIIFSCDWELETGERVLPLPPDMMNIPLRETDWHTTQIIASGPGFPEGVMHQALLTSIYAARSKLVITTPYLVPSDDLLYAICTAAQRGVEVHILIPRYNDSLLVNWASRVFFTELLEAGVLIHLFEGGLLHTKSVLVDEQLSLVGTANLDMRSLWLNFEITLVIDDTSFGKALDKIQTDYMTRSSIIEKKTWLKRPYWQRIIERLFYFFSPLL